jgi:hypothetical protein
MLVHTFANNTIDQCTQTETSGSPSMNSSKTVHDREVIAMWKRAMCKVSDLPLEG